MSALGPIELLFLVAPLLARPAGPPAGGRPRRDHARAEDGARAATVGGPGRSGILPRRPRRRARRPPRLPLAGRDAAGGPSRRPCASCATSDGRPSSSIDAGCAMLPIGGGWLVLSRLGVSVLGFEEPIILLTAVHFHYAAFATLVLVGLAGRFTRDGAAYRAIAAGAVSGPPLLAAGITLSPSSRWPRPWLLVLASGRPPAVHPREDCPAVSAGGPCPAYRLLLVALWPLWRARPPTPSASSPGPWSPWARLARIHGPLNALGFALAGLSGLDASRLASTSAFRPCRKGQEEEMTPNTYPVWSYLVYVAAQRRADRLGRPHAPPQRPRVPRGRLPRQRGARRLRQPPARRRLLPDQRRLRDAGPAVRRQARRTCRPRSSSSARRSASSCWSWARCTSSTCSSSRACAAAGCASRPPPVPPQDRVPVRA